MMHEDVIIEPVLSEKATELREQGKYVFKVHPDATKLDIKEAVRKLFNVKEFENEVKSVKLEKINKFLDNMFITENITILGNV